MSKKAKDVQADVTRSVHRIWLAGLGALAIAQEEGGKLFSSLVKRGGELEGRGDWPAPSVTGGIKDARERAAATWEKVGKDVDAQLTAVLHRLGVPTRDEIATLAKRVDSLTASVEKLRAGARATPRGGEPPAAAGE